jgi:hypothetical protein
MRYTVNNKRWNTRDISTIWPVDWPGDLAYLCLYETESGDVYHLLELDYELEVVGIVEMDIDKASALLAAQHRDVVRMLKGSDVRQRPKGFAKCPARCTAVRTPKGIEVCCGTT